MSKQRRLNRATDYLSQHIKMRKLLFLCIVQALFVTAVLPAFAKKETNVLTDKIILGKLMKNLDVLLEDSAYCKGVGTDENDRTIGDYLSGFWSYHTQQQGQNWLEINSSKTTNAHHLVKVMIYRKDAERNWGWGVSFLLSPSLKLQKNSFTCLGSG